MHLDNSKTMKSRETPMMDSDLIYLKGIQKACANELPPIRNNENFTSKVLQVSKQSKAISNDKGFNKSLEREKIRHKI